MNGRLTCLRFGRKIAVGLLALASLLAVSTASAKRFTIIVNAEADDAYLAEAEKKSYQTYHFYKGEYFGGFTRDKGLEQTEFNDIAESVAVALRKRNFYPEPNKELGDLLIMISWGRTALDPDYMELMGVTGADEMLSQDEQDRRAQNGGVSPTATGVGGTSSASIQSDSMSMTGMAMLKSKTATNKAKNIRLLGLGKDLNQAFNAHLSRDALWDVLDEERYFIVLNAFDYQHLREHKELKEVWSARYSTRATGIGFKAAYESMNLAVSGVLGLKLDKLSKVKGDTESTIEMGEVEVMGYGDEAGE